MISSINSYSARTQLRQNQQRRVDNVPQRQANPPSFKGGMGILSYFLVDFVAIFTSCSAEAAVFRSKDFKLAHESAKSTIKVKYSKQLKEMTNLAANISQSLQRNTRTKKMGEKLQKTFEKAFGVPAERNYKTAPITGSIYEQLNNLHNKAEAMGVKLNDDKKYATIAQPVMQRTKAIIDALRKQEAADTAKARSGSRSRALSERAYDSLIPKPIEPKSQHP